MPPAPSHEARPLPSPDTAPVDAAANGDALATATLAAAGATETDSTADTLADDRSALGVEVTASITAEEPDDDDPAEEDGVTGAGAEREGSGERTRPTAGVGSGLEGAATGVESEPEGGAELSCATDPSGKGCGFTADGAGRRRTGPSVCAEPPSAPDDTAPSPTPADEPRPEG